MSEAQIMTLGLIIMTIGFLIFVSWTLTQEDYRPKQRRCRDCKYIHRRYSRVRSMCPVASAYDLMFARHCKNYTRKWWKFWRAK